VPKILIIDASVALAAGSVEPAKPSSRATRIFLFAVLEMGHFAGMTEELSIEWGDHAARFARSWRRQMLGRKRIKALGSVGHPPLRRRISRTATTKAAIEALDKDYHLVHGALASDRIVASLDETARALFHDAKVAVRELHTLFWVNPDLESDLPEWLSQDAPNEASRRL
jgi:hypothetical protein